MDSWRQRCRQQPRLNPGRHLQFRPDSLLLGRRLGESLNMLLQFFCHLIETSGQLLHLVASVDFQLLVQIACRYLLYSFRQRTDRTNQAVSQDAAGEKGRQCQGQQQQQGLSRPPRKGLPQNFIEILHLLLNQGGHLLGRRQDLVLTNERSEAPACILQGRKGQIVFLPIHQHLHHIILSGSHATGGFCQSRFRILPQICPLKSGSQHSFAHGGQHHSPIAIQTEADARPANGNLPDPVLQILDTAVDAYHSGKPIFIIVRSSTPHSQIALFCQENIRIRTHSLGLSHLVPGTLPGVVSFQKRRPGLR